MEVQGDWGQGAANNEIFWGQAAQTPDAEFGTVQPQSYGHPVTNLLGNLSRTIWNLITTAWNSWTTTWKN